MTVERTTESRELHDLSPSRIKLAQACGLAFRYRYVDKLPSATHAAAAIFGTVLHTAVAKWYDEGPTTDDNRHQHKDLDLVQLVRDEWPERLPPAIWTAVNGLIEYDKELEKVAEAIKLGRPNLKAPRSTKAFLESSAQKEFQDKRMALFELTENYSEIRWGKNDDPFKEYQRSLEIADRLQREWKPLPRPLAVEEPFRLEFEGYTIRGAIDQVRQDPDRETGQMGPPRLVDMKSNKQLMSQMEAFMQSWTYNIALRQIENLPATNLVEFWMLRHKHENLDRVKVQRGTIDPDRHDKIALRILNGTSRKIITGQYEPNYGHGCKMCDYRPICEQELTIWDGEGVTL